MDINYELNGIAFVWNADKAKSNIDKHDGISFEQACTVFFDPFFVVKDATQNFEYRQAIIGYDANNKLLFVVHLEQFDDTIRIISARRATAYERKDYDNQ